MNTDFIHQISAELNIPVSGVKETVKLLTGGSTVPFIARYRKEATGSLDEVQITAIRDRWHQILELEKRREAILSSLDERGKLTDELKKDILAAETLSKLEDIYLPYRPKRRTRATVAKEKGLEPLAEKILEQKGIDAEEEAKKFLDAEKGVESVEDALAGARDIIAEWVNENAQVRDAIRKLFFEEGKFTAKVIKGKEEEGAKFKDYFDWEEPVRKVPSHRLLAARRGEKENILMLRVVAPENKACELIEEIYLKGKGEDSRQVQMAIYDSYKRLLSLSMETEIRMATKEDADREAINVFAQNLRQLLMASPVGEKRMMAVDPGFRTGCKVACLDERGRLLEYTTIFPTGSQRQRDDSAETIREFSRKHRPGFIAIGNGTASRETEGFIRGLGLPKEIHVAVVSEAGASVYSASEAAREEFPDLDVTVRGAISIGRRLMDPLAELVKIDPKSIGVGQYQHDVDQNLLKQSLDDVVISCVNQVGVELNTASKQLLTYVSGVGPVRAQKIIDYRHEKGGFKSRDELAAVTGLGPKAIEQAAGFLRIRGAENPLDESAVHPERYPVVERMARDLSCSVRDLMKDENLRRKIDLDKYVDDTVGLPTLRDIYQELAKPGRDPRDKFEIFEFKEGIEKPEDLKPGMTLPGIVTNITRFGAFVDVGVHLDGLVHISQMSDKFVRDPNDIVKVQQKVEVTVVEVDLERNRIALSMRRNPHA